MRTINIINKSTVVTEAQLAPVIEALQTQVNRDFFPAYGLECLLTTLPEDTAKERIYILDDSDQAGALGYHEETGAVPVGYVFAKTDLDYGESWSATLSHELLEQLADPFVNLTALGNMHGLVTLFSYEACDAVENDEYTINGVAVSNFVLPAWYTPDSKGPYDFLKKLAAPLTLDSGGYIGYQARLGIWKEVFGDRAKTHQMAQRSHSRRKRRQKKS